jgi:elongation factor Ts
MVSIEKIKELRDETEASIMECRKALESAGGDMDKARKILAEQGQKLAAKRADRETCEGIIDSYIHAGGKVGVLIELHCESDFVARSDDFRNLAHELCLQIAAMPSEQKVLEQPWIKDQSKTVKDLVAEYISKFGENITLEAFARYEL